MTSRATKALEVMKDGCYFRKQLETQYRGGEKFEYRLRDKTGCVVKGIGFNTWHELHQLGMLAYRECHRSTVWPSEWTATRYFGLA